MIIEVELAGRSRPVTCTTDDPEVALGDRLIIEQPDGRTNFGTCVRVPLDLPWPDDAVLPRTVRRASLDDEERESHLQRQREEWLDLARRQAAELQVPMRVLRSDTAPASRKAVFQFLAEGRVDFRELVRDLARRMRARVELRQIGVRDAAVVQGGVGHCGQGLCCSTWLTGFAPVSMRMAKAQGLPLNPTKISGQCGRLMCCLRYELGADAPVTPGGETADEAAGAAAPQRVPRERSGNGRGGGPRCGGCRSKS